jgi:enoyl-CoA hydratase/carnithine racemase
MRAQFQEESMASTSSAPVVLSDRVAPGIAVVKLNRPEARNALSTGLIERMLDLLSSLAEDHELRVLVLTGAGERAFCAGADLHERRRLNAEQRTVHTNLINDLADAVATFPVPVIAAIRGYALAGGMELALACDLRVASTDAAFGLPEVKIGIFPGAGGVVRLPRLVGPGNARELIYTGRQVPASEAFEIGLADHLVEPLEVMPVAIHLAESIAANAPLAIRAAKQALWESEGLPERAAHRIVQQHRRSLDTTRDYAEGLAAFAERREPRFTGH